jgi:hypothetical protein
MLRVPACQPVDLLKASPQFKHRVDIIPSLKFIVSTRMFIRVETVNYLVILNL